MAQLITLTKVGIFDGYGSQLTVTSESIRVAVENISSVETHSSGAIVMLQEPQKLDGDVITGYVVTQTPAQIQTLIDTTASSLAASDGTVGAPSISFVDDTDSGFYRIGADNIGGAVNGAKVIDISTTGVAVTGTHSATGVVSGVGLTSTGINKHAGTPQTLTGAGAVNITTHSTLLVTTAADALTLADGAEGQYKYIQMKTDGGDGTLTPTNLRGGSTITFNDAGDFVLLYFIDGEWSILTNSGCTVA